MSNDQILQDFQEAFPGNIGVKKFITRLHFAEVQIAAAVLPARITLFKTAPTAPAKFSLSQNGKVQNDFICKSIGVAWFGSSADLKTIQKEMTLVVKLNGATVLEETPISSLCSGGGNASDHTTASGVNGVPAFGARMPISPIGIGTLDDLEVELISKGTTAIAVTDLLRVDLWGQEAKKVQ